MKTNTLLIVLVLLLSSCGKETVGREDELQDFYALLDSEIARSDEYDNVKNMRIADYRQRYASTTSERMRTELLDMLVKEFDAYNADSALYYVNLNLRRPVVRRDSGHYTRLQIKKADIYAHAGLFFDALATLQSIPRDSLDGSLLEEYFSTYCATYQYLSEYTDAHEMGDEYSRLRSVYTDSLNSVIDTASFNYKVFVQAELARQGDTHAPIEVLTECLANYPSGTREYSILASTLGYIYSLDGKQDEFKRYLTLSAISDVRGAVKENMSFRAVATVMFEDGDIERANRYLKKSIADANFYSALMRNAQSSKMLPVIDEAYASVQNSLNRRLRNMVLVSSILSVILFVAVFYVLKQIRNVRRAKDSLTHANEDLSRLSVQLREMNGKLADRNAELHEFNRTKEQYAGLFMEYCSAAISALQRYQQSLRNLTVQGANRSALLKKLESSETADQLLKEFYLRFDEAILDIYPSFVDKFNALLKPDSRVVLKSGELLNTELRLFALIRIGIDDSNKIAQFLRCSISTVYTYRSKMRKRAVNPDEFEDEIKNIV